MTRRCLFLLFFLLATLSYADDFLDPAVAFRPTARAIDGQNIEVRFAIAKGYYLYRDKFRFAAEPATVQLGAAALPPGKAKDDETFGKVEVYYETVAIRLPVERNSSGPLALILKVTSQGCADAGLCYPPQQQKLSLQLPDPTARRAFRARSGDRRIGTHRAIVPPQRFLAARRQLLRLWTAVVADAMRLSDDSPRARWSRPYTCRRWRLASWPSGGRTGAAHQCRINPADPAPAFNHRSPRGISPACSV